MTINLKFMSLLAVGLLSTLSSCTVASAEENIGLAPEATAAEATLSFRDIPDLKEAFINASPTDRKDGIPVGELGIDGGNKAMILKLAQEIADVKHDNFDSLLIAYKGKLLFESYYLRGRINLPHFQASATKVYTGLALGRAIELGYLSMADLDKPLVSFLKDLDPTKFVEGVEKITLHQALTMRSGIRISKEQTEEFEKNPGQLKGQGQVQAYLEHSAPISIESQSFKYQFDPTLVMQVLDAVVPGTAKDFIKKELLDKMGITNYDWRTDVSGLPRAGSGSSMTSRDMVKWGTLAINKGKWNGEQLVPKAFLAKATSRVIYTGDDDVYGGGKDVSNQGYGYYWWNADLKYDNKSYFSASAQGGGGQYIILIEELDLMVVVTAHDNDNRTLQITAEKILPAFIQNSVSTMSGKSDHQNKLPVLEGPYIGQKPPGLTPEVFAPGIVSTEHRDWTGFFTPDMKEYYFGRYNSNSGKSTKVLFKFENNRWHESVLELPLGGAISPDGKTMHSGKEYRERTDDGWSELKSLGTPFEDIFIMRLTASSKGTYVFDEGTREGDGVLRYSRLVNGEREAPRPFSKEINSGKWTAHPFIAPDESYIIWDSERDGGYGGVDLYISFKQQDGSYGDAINFGDTINTEGPDSGGVVSPDGKYFFFNRKISPEDSDIYWVDAQIIEMLRPKLNDSSAPEATAAEAALSFRDIPDLKEAFIDTAPADRKDGLAVGDLVVNGGNKSMLVMLAQEIADRKHGDYDSLLIAHQGKLLFESYYLRGRVNLPHYQASATKAYTSLAVGRAMQLGYLTMADLDKPLVSFLKDLDPTKFVDGVEKITLHQALTMRSGLRFSAEQLKEFEDNSSKFRGVEQIQAFFELSAPVTTESQSYNYDTSPLMVMQVLDAVVPGSAKGFIKNELFGKIGINDYSWRNDPGGLPSGGGGSSLTSRDMLKLGALVNNKGQWNGEQLIAAKYLARATSKITKPTEDWQPDSFNYGYYWYQTDLTVGAKSYDAKIAWGGGGQHIVALEELDLVIVVTGHDREDTIMTQVSKTILPAFVK